jgi:ribonuclease-3
VSPDGAGPVQEALGYSFRDPELLAEALTHKSLHYERPAEAPNHNERLEFLGDSVLGFLAAEQLFRMEQGFTESQMSKVKSYIVMGAVLLEVGRELGVGRAVRLSRGEEETGGREKSSILSDALEAVIGAVYLDGGMEAVRDLVLRLFGGRLLRVVDSGQYHDYKSELQEECQMRLGCLPEYRLLAQEGREHERLYTVEVLLGGEPRGRGSGRSKKAAQAEAARVALEGLRRLEAGEP